MRVLAAALLGRGDPARASGLAEKLLTDHVSFGRLATSPGVQVDGLLRSRFGDVHYQGVVLPHLLARGDLQTLGQVADHAKLPLATRLGAVEGLASLGREDAEARLLRVAQKDGEDEELHKAAWRGLRRSQRARKRSVSQS